MPPVLLLGGLAALGYAAFQVFRSVQEDKEQQLQFRAQNGWSLGEVAAELTAGFDSDRDGRLAFDAVRGMRTLGESTHVVSRTFTTSPGLVGLVLPAGTQLVREHRTTYSIEPLLRRADADQDGVATLAEVAQVLRTYDADGNGRLSAAERRAATSALGQVKVSSDERTVGVVQPTQQSTPPRR